MFIRFLLLVEVHGSLLCFGRLLNQSMLACLPGIAYALLLSSMLEWAVHRYIYHGQAPLFTSLRRAHAFHHAAFAESYVVPLTELAYRRHRGRWLNLDAIIVRAGQVLLHVSVIALLMVVPSWFATRSFAFTFDVGLTAGCLSLLNLYLHEAMHRRRDRWITGTRLFQQLDIHHSGHHENPRLNFNLLLPLADYLFGTGV